MIAHAESPRLAIRTSGCHPNHHLWNNHGTWYVCYTVHPTPFTVERVRRSLRTKDVEIARRERDVVFARLTDQPDASTAGSKEVAR